MCNYADSKQATKAVSSYFMIMTKKQGVGIEAGFVMEMRMCMMQNEMERVSQSLGEIVEGLEC